MTEIKSIPSDSLKTPDRTSVYTQELELGNSTLQVRFAADVDEGYLERLKQFCSPQSDGYR